MHRSASSAGEAIIAVRAIPYVIPYVKPLRFASGSISTADNVLIQIETESGITGWAEAPPRPYTYGETQESIVAVVEKVFAPQIIGCRVFEREKIRSAMNRTVGNLTAKGAVDMALWDIAGKLLEVNVHQLLGGYTGSLKVSHMLGFDEPEQVGEEAVALRETYGINSFKIKVGRRPIDDDVAVCRAVREAVGEDTELYLDGNRGWNATESAEALRKLADVGLSRVEELNPADEITSRKWLVERSPVLFVADESAPTLATITREVLSGAANALSIKTARSGFTDSLRIVGLAEGLGIETFIGNQIDAHLGTVCSLVFGAALAGTAKHAAELSNWLDLEDTLLTEELVIHDGEMKVPTRPGIGVDIDPAKLDHYRVDDEAKSFALLT